MKIPKLIIWILFAVIALLSAYTIFSNTQKAKEIKLLTRELAVQVDSLQKISNEYKRLQQNYDTIYGHMIFTRNHFVSFYHDVDSIFHSAIGSIDKIQKTLKVIIKEESVINTVDTSYIPPPIKL